MYSILELEFVGVQLYPSCNVSRVGGQVSQLLVLFLSGPDGTLFANSKLTIIDNVDVVRARHVCLTNVPESDNPTDCMTKPLEVEPLSKMMGNMGLVCLDGVSSFAPRLTGV